MPAKRAPIRVLVAEDNDDTRDMYADYLRRYAGMDVETAVDGQQAVEMALDWHPEVIVMDLSMPRLPGDEAAHILKTDARTKHIAILILTAYAFGGRNRSRLSGADAFCRKPCQPSDLAKMVKSLVAVARREQPKRSSSRTV